MNTVKLNELKKSGETFFKRKADAKGVFVVEHYNRTDKTFTCSNYETGAEIFLKATTTVHIGFEY